METVIPTPRGTITLFAPEDEWAQRQSEQTRTRVLKGIQYLGPWCPDCGKKGQKCKNEKSCKTRALKSALSGFERKGFLGITLPRAPHEWLNAKGKPTNYRITSDERYLQDQQYAYELAMGLVDNG